ncbi:MAG TPA: YlxR family protein [Candidatus Limnocylindrales bacterium]|nr:YlxR family protein [Candidatus Limnocylindrales bacterium]
MACRTTRPKGELIRIVRTPGGELKIDETGRVAGRGAYLCRDVGCWRTGLERGAVGRSLGTPMTGELRETLLAGLTSMTTEGGASGTK